MKTKESIRTNERKNIQKLFMIQTNYTLNLTIHRYNKHKLDEKNIIRLSNINDSKEHEALNNCFDTCT